MFKETKCLVLIAVLLFMLNSAACASGPTEKQRAFAGELQSLSTTLGQLEERSSSLDRSGKRLEQLLNQLEDRSGSLLLDASRVGMNRSEFLPSPPAGQVTVQFLAEVENSGLPGDFTFHMAPEGAELFTTESVPKGQSLDIGQKIMNGVAFVEPGKFYRLQVVYRNPDDNEAKFLVRGGLVDPQVALPFVRNLCWCAAIPFSAPPEGTFSRIIEVGVGPDTPPGARAIVVFPVVPLSQ